MIAHLLNILMHNEVIAMPKKMKFVYFFGGGKAEGKASMRELLGGKGAGLHEMTRIGVPVPPGFTITTDVCTYYYALAAVILKTWKSM